MGFEKFEATGQGRGRGNSEPMISIRKSGSIGINNAALEQFFEEEHEGVVMYFDDDTGEIGMNPVEDGDEDEAYTLTRSDSGGSVTPSAFLTRNGLVPERTEQYSPRTEKVNQNLELVVFERGEHSEDFIGYYGSPEDDAEEAEADD
jgi:hypothetical protein